MKLKKLASVIFIISILCIFLSLNLSFSASAETEYTEGYYTYTVKNGEATITKCDKSISGDVKVPDTLGGYPVTKIGYRAFYKCDNILELNLPDSLTYIEDMAFEGCNSIQSITLPFIGRALGSSSGFLGIFFSLESFDKKYLPEIILEYRLH